jgi:hypothetical protein
VLIIGKGDVGADKDIVSYTQAIPQLHPAFNRDTVTYNNIVFDQAVRADVAALADLRAGQDHNELPDTGVRADGRGLDIGQRMDKGRVHFDAENIPLKSACQKGLSFLGK